MRRQPNFLVGQLAERAEKDLSPPPGRGARRNVDQEFAPDFAKAAIEVSLLGEFFFEQGNPQTRESSFQGVEL